MASRKRDPRRGIVRRDDRPRQRLSPDLERLARGEDDRVRPPPRRPRIRDERPIALVPGVANRDARAVFDARLARLEAARKKHPDDPSATAALAEGLREALSLRLWRGRSLTGFGVFVEQLLDLGVEAARELAGDAPELTDESIAVWMRAEAGLLAAELPARVRVAVEDGRERVVIEIDPAQAPDAVRAIADHLGQLRGDLGRPRRR